MLYTASHEKQDNKLLSISSLYVNRSQRAYHYCLFVDLVTVLLRSGVVAFGHNQSWSYEFDLTSAPPTTEPGRLLLLSLVIRCWTAI